MSLKCPFDDTPLRFDYNQWSKWYECPSCQTGFSTYPVIAPIINQDEINFQARKYVKKWGKELVEITFKKENLEKMLNLARESGLIDKS